MSTNENQIAFQERRNVCDREQYDILRRCSEKKNIAEWNKYRAEHPETKINLQNADLRGARLEGAQLREGNFRGARFEGADLFASDATAPESIRRRRSARERSIRSVLVAKARERSRRNIP